MQDQYFGILYLDTLFKIVFVSFRNSTISPLQQIKNPLSFSRKFHAKLKFNQSRSTIQFIPNLNLSLPTYVSLLFRKSFKFTYLRKKVNLYLSLIRPQPKSWGPIELGCPSVRPSVCLSVCHRFLVRAKTFEWKVIETWLQAQMKGISPQMCLLTILVKNTLPEVVKLAKNSPKQLFSRLELVRVRTFEGRSQRQGYRLK